MIGSTGEVKATLSVLRVRTGGQPLEAVWQSWGSLCLGVHWFGRSLVCPGPSECPACELQRRAERVYGIVAVEGREGLIPTLLEVPLGAWRRALERDGCGAETLEPGRVLRLHRAGKRKSTVIELLGEKPAAAVLAWRDDWRIAAAVSALYQLPPIKLGEAVSDWAERSQPIARRRVELAVARQ